MKIAVVGAAGQLGLALQAILPNEVIPWTSAQANLNDPESLQRVIGAAQPDVVINCGAYNFVDRAESEPELAFAVNAIGVRSLARCCQSQGCVLVHISSDHVFGLDSDRKQPYREEDAPGPISVYGTSKLMGEYFVRSIVSRHFVIRTCGLFGPRGEGGKGGNFVDAILRRATEGKPLRVVADQICSPTSTRLLAQALAKLIRTDAFGLYHLTTQGACSWFEFAQAIVKHADLAADVTAITSAEFAATARRPSYSVLDGSRFDRLQLLPRAVWEDELLGYLAIRLGI